MSLASSYLSQNDSMKHPHRVHCTFKPKKSSWPIGNRRPAACPRDPGDTRWNVNVKDCVLRGSLQRAYYIDGLLDCNFVSLDPADKPRDVGMEGINCFFRLKNL